MKQAKGQRGKGLVRVTVVLQDIDRAIVERVELEKGVSRSAAVRMLIRKAAGVENAGCQQAAR
jgi:hypothetical protein